MKNIEIERKFLLKNNDYKPFITKSVKIKQGYISVEKGNSVRVRSKGDKAFLTIKSATNCNGISRFEWEREIDVDDLQGLFSLCKGGIIEKTRHLVPSGKHIIEIDEFEGDNEGLVLAEIELETENEPYEKPSWLGDEVTGNRQYYNYFLSKFPYKTWK